MLRTGDLGDGVVTVGSLSESLHSMVLGWVMRRLGSLRLLRWLVQLEILLKE